MAGEKDHAQRDRAAQNGIVGGYGDGMFGPNDPITREQLAAMLWRYAGSPAATPVQAGGSIDNDNFLMTFGSMELLEEYEYEYNITMRGADGADASLTGTVYCGGGRLFTHDTGMWAPCWTP